MVCRTGSADAVRSPAPTTRWSGTRALGINSYDAASQADLGRHQYTGQARLPEIGVYNHKARLYSPTIGRFLSTDPIGYADGMSWYSYVHGDPVNGTGPTGQTSRTTPAPPAAGRASLAAARIDFKLTIKGAWLER